MTGSWLADFFGRWAFWWNHTVANYVGHLSVGCSPQLQAQCFAHRDCLHCSSGANMRLVDRPFRNAHGMFWENSWTWSRCLLFRASLILSPSMSSSLPLLICVRHLASDVREPCAQFGGIWHIFACLVRAMVLISETSHHGFPNQTVPGLERSARCLSCFQ